MHTTLKKLIAERGNAILDPSSAPILRAILSDISPNANRREISGLLIAVEEGVVLELIGLKNKRIDAAQYNSFLARIVTDRGIDRNFAEWILGEWIKALDKQLPGPQVLGSTFTEDDSTAPRIKGAAIRPAGASIVIDVNPKGALVNISGPNSFNKTGGASWKLDQLLPGTYKIVSSAESYEPDEQDIVIRPDASLNFSTTLKTLGSLSIKGSPTGAKLEVSGPASFSTVTGLPARIDGLYKGKYKISVTAKDYESEVRFADVEPEKMTSVSFNLLRRGTLEITGSPGGAKVDISGPANFKVSSGLPVTIDSAWKGDYSITVSRDGYISVKESISVEPQKLARLSVKLITEEEHKRQLGTDRLAKATTSNAAKPFIDEFRRNGWEDLVKKAQEKTNTLAAEELAEERRKQAIKEAEERRREEARRAEERRREEARRAEERRRDEARRAEEQLKWEREAEAEARQMAARQRTEAANAAKRFGQALVMAVVFGFGGGIVGLILAIFMGWGAFWVIFILAILIGFGFGISMDPSGGGSSSS